MDDFELQLRWADLDTLNHVNNVRYVDYALEATERLIEDGVLAADRPICRLEVDYLRPLLLSRRPVRVSQRLAGTRLVQEVRSADTVYARISTDFGVAGGQLAAVPPSVAVHLSQLRRADLGTKGQVSVAKVFELFQEARIAHFSELKGEHAAGSFVVANLVVELARPIAWRRRPLTIESWVSRVGDSSFGTFSRIVEDDTVFASCAAVMVGFDLATQKSRRFGDTERAALSATLP